MCHFKVVSLYSCDEFLRCRFFDDGLSFNIRKPHPRIGLASGHLRSHANSTPGISILAGEKGKN